MGKKLTKESKNKSFLAQIWCQYQFIANAAMQTFLIFYKIWAQLIKKRMNLNSEVVLVALNCLVSHATTVVASYMTWHHLI